MTEIRSVSLPDAYSKWVDKNVDSLTEYVQTKIEEDADGDLRD